MSLVSGWQLAMWRLRSRALLMVLLQILQVADFDCCLRLFLTIEPGGGDEESGMFSYFITIFGLEKKTACEL